MLKLNSIVINSACYLCGAQSCRC